MSASTKRPSKRRRGAARVKAGRSDGFRMDWVKDGKAEAMMCS